MKAEDTGMNELEMRVVLNEASWQSPTIPFSYHSAIANAQAKQTELMLKEQWKHEGRKEVVEWIKASGDASLYNQHGDYTDDWQAKLKEWDIK